MAESLGDFKARRISSSAREEGGREGRAGKSWGDGPRPAARRGGSSPPSRLAGAPCLPVGPKVGLQVGLLGSTAAAVILR